MVNSSCESHLRRLERVVGGKVNGEEEDPALVGTVRGSHDGRLGDGGVIMFHEMTNTRLAFDSWRETYKVDNNL